MSGSPKILKQSKKKKRSSTAEMLTAKPSIRNFEVSSIPTRI
jgi:hypothetical protein